MICTTYIVSLPASCTSVHKPDELLLICGAYVLHIVLAATATEAHKPAGNNRLRLSATVWGIYVVCLL